MDNKERVWLMLKEREVKVERDAFDAIWACAQAEHLSFGSIFDPNYAALFGAISINIKFKPTHTAVSETLDKHLPPHPMPRRL